MCKIVNIYSGKHFLHSTKPEITVTVDGIKHPVGGVSGQFGHTFIDSSWYGKFCKSEGFNFEKYEIDKVKREIVWKKRRHSSSATYPPEGICLKAYFTSEKPELSGIKICVKHELFDGLQTFGKSFEIINESGKT